MTSLRGTNSALLSAAARLGYSLQRQGVRRSISELATRLRARVNPTAGSTAGPALPGLERCTWLADQPGVVAHDLHVTRRQLGDFLRLARYPRFYYRGDRRIRYALWHLVGFELCRLCRDDVVLDAGAQAGIWGRIARRLAGCRVYDIDLAYPPGVHGHRIGTDAGHIPLDDSFATHIVCFCAFNCFEGSADIDFLRCAGRILRPGGRLVIVPLCIGDDYVNLFDPRLCGGDFACDPAAKPVPWPGWGNRFGRWYDQSAFRSRIVANLPGFKFHIHRIHHDIPGMIPAGSFHAAAFIKP